MSYYIGDNNGSNAYGYGQFSLYDNMVASEGPSKLIRENLKKAAAGKYQQLMDLLGSKSFKNMKGMNMQEKLMMILELILDDLDKNITKTISDLQKKSKDMKRVTSKQAEKNPGLMSSLNADTSILQVQLQMLVQRRQQFVENITNALKSAFDADMNTVRRIV